LGEELCSAAVRRAGAALSIVTIRPSWCQDERNIARNLGPFLRDASLPQDGLWSYIIISDLARAILLAATLPLTHLAGRHEVVYIAAADNIGGRDFAAAVAQHYGGTVPLRLPLSRPDASGIDCAKAKALLGWEPRKTWRDFLNVDGTVKAAGVSSS
jgi:nucleoside-diphosphate-sugar epimerase